MAHLSMSSSSNENQLTSARIEIKLGVPQGYLRMHALALSHVTSATNFSWAARTSSHRIFS